MTRRTYTDDEKAQALALYVDHGPAEASRRSGVPVRTISDWAGKAGIASMHVEKMAEAIEARQGQIETRKLELAALMLEDAFKLRAQLWQPCVVKVVKTVGTGLGTSDVEIVEVDLDKPSFHDQALIQKAAAIGVDKVQILTGGATERTEHTLTDDRQSIEALRDDLAERRALRTG